MSLVLAAAVVSVVTWGSTAPAQAGEPAARAASAAQAAPAVPAPPEVPAPPPTPPVPQAPVPQTPVTLPTPPTPPAPPAPRTPVAQTPATLPTPPTPPVPAVPPQPAAALRVPAPPPPPAKPGQNVNVQVELTITETTAGTPGTMIVSMLASDANWGRVRSQGSPRPNPSAVFDTVVLNVDARPTLLGNDTLRLELTVEYMPPTADATTADDNARPARLHQSLNVILKNGQPLQVSRAVDPVSKRTTTVDVKATRLP